MGSDEVAHYTSKRRVTPSDGALRHTDQPVPIVGVYLLEPLEPLPENRGFSAAMLPLGRRPACMEIIKGAFQLDLANPAATCRSFEQVARLAAICSVSKLQYVRDFECLDQVVDMLLDDYRD